MENGKIKQKYQPNGFFELENQIDLPLPDFS
jgi:hypothetical protein